MAAGKFRPRPWGWHDIERLIELREVQRLTWRRIDDELRRSHGQSAARYQHEMDKRERQKNMVAPPAPHYAEPKPAARDVIARTEERDARRDAYDRRDLTATFCGDPPVGYSALDDRLRGRR